MVKSTDTRQSDNLSVGRWSRRNGALLRCILYYGVNTFLVVVGDITAEQSSQMVFIEYDYVIYDLAFAGSDPALGSPVFPRAPVRRSFGRDAERFN